MSAFSFKKGFSLDMVAWSCNLSHDTKETKVMKLRADRATKHTSRSEETVLKLGILTAIANDHAILSQKVSLSGLLSTQMREN